MARVTVAPLVLALLAQATAPASTSAKLDCAGIAQVDSARKAELPPGAAAALGFEMAEADEAFQVTDAIVRPGLPFRRFVSARQIGCRLQVVFDRGGRGLSRDMVDLLFTDRGWTHWAVRRER